MSLPAMMNALESRPMGDGEQTQLAPSETETSSVRAWGLDEIDYDDDPPPTRITAGRITGVAVAASLAAIAAAGVLAWQHLRTEDAPVSVAATGTMVPATMIAAPVVVAPPAPPPVPAPVTITTVVKQVQPTGGWAPSTPPQATNMPIPAEVVAIYDQRLIENLQAENWSIWDPAAIARSAHQVCAALRRGDSLSLIRQQMVEAGPVNETEAVSFTSNVMRTYPACP